MPKENGLHEIMTHTLAQVSLEATGKPLNIAFENVNDLQTICCGLVRNFVVFQQLYFKEAGKITPNEVWEKVKEMTKELGGKIIQNNAISQGFEEYCKKF